MSEGFKEPVLKTGDGATHRGFESHSLRHAKTVDFGRRFLWITNKKKLLNRLPIYVQHLADFSLFVEGYIILTT